MNEPAMLPLEGIRVIEIGQALAGPLAGAILADMGADVIKVEKPNGGDDARAWGPPFGPDGTTSLYFHAQNRNKRSLVLDLKSAADQETLHALCETADILIQNLRPGVVEGIGIDAKTMCTRHPRLVYCNISSFGQVGPMNRHPGFDPLLQAYGAMMSMTGRPDEEPNFCGAPINDKATGMFCVIGALSALRRRDITGKGGIIDTSLFESAVHWVEGPLNAHISTGDTPMRNGTGGSAIVPYQVFHAADLPLVIAAGNERMFKACAAVLGHPEWCADPRFATGPQRVINKNSLVEKINTALKARTRDAWISALEAAAVPCSPVHDIADLAATEQLTAVDMLQHFPETGVKVVGLPLSIDGQRPRSSRPAPKVGEHSDEILSELTAARAAFHQ